VASNAKARRRKGRKDENELSYVVIGASIDVHRRLGPGLLEAVYEACLCAELDRVGVRYERQKAVPVVYDGAYVGIGYRLDLLVEGVLVVEVKAVAEMLPIHKAQLLTYLRLADCRLGLLINFGLETAREGIERIANGLPQ
jgi:GxxExxY protein